MYFEASPEQTEKQRPKSTAEILGESYNHHSYDEDKQLSSEYLTCDDSIARKHYFSKKLVSCVHTRKMLHHKLQTKSR